MCLPKGSETSTNLTFSSTTDVEGTNSPRMMPTAMARKIHTASNLSSQASRFTAGLSASCSRAWRHRREGARKSATGSGGRGPAWPASQEYTTTVSRRTCDYFGLVVAILKLFGNLRRCRIGSWRRRILQGRRMHGRGCLYLIHLLLFLLS
jgi:hypothetical protein